MSFKVENMEEKNMVKLVIEATAEEFEAGLNTAFNKNKNKISVPGFRKGKAPRKMVEKLYGTEIFYEDAANAIIPDAYAKAADESELEIVSQPKINVVQIEAGKPFIFEAVVAVKPEVELGQYKGVEVEKCDTEVTDADVEEELKKVQDKNSRVVTVEDRAVKDGDMTTIDFEGFVDGVAFEGGSGENYPLELGSGSFIPGFEEQLVGVKKGEEKDVEVTFPENYQAAELAGQPATFHCTVHEVKYKDLPELNDELIKKLKIENVETVDAYKEKVKTDLTAQKEREAEENFTNELLGKVCDNANVEIPAVMIDAEVDRMYKEFEGRMQQSGFTAKQFLEATHQTEEAIRAQMSPEAAARVKTQLVLEAIVKAESIEASDEDVEKEFTTMSEMYNMEVEKIKSLISPESIKADLANQKALDFIKTSVK